MFIGHDFVYKTQMVLTIWLPGRFWGNFTKRFSTTYLVMQPRTLKCDFPHLHVCPALKCDFPQDGLRTAVLQHGRPGPFLASRLGTPGAPKVVKPWRAGQN